MITQEIKLYEEPEPYKYTPTPPALPNSYSYGKYFTAADISQERSRAAMAGIKIGTKFKSLNNPSILEVVSYETDPVKCEDIDGDPACIKILRTAAIGDKMRDMVFHYTVAELVTNNHLEMI